MDLRNMLRWVCAWRWGWRFQGPHPCSFCLHAGLSPRMHPGHWQGARLQVQGGGERVQLSHS